ncbi:MAG: hypothetical protein Q8755_03105, partial [Candidatus Phytoplasma australasiaticum]|nr:hypothetical protein [Candidatus Phytoplasma australasiaticum]
HDLFSQLIKFGFTWEQLSFYFEFENKNFAIYINKVLKGKKIYNMTIYHFLSKNLSYPNQRRKRWGMMDYPQHMSYY